MSVRTKALAVGAALAAIAALLSPAVVVAQTGGGVVAPAAAKPAAKLLGGLDQIGVAPGRFALPGGDLTVAYPTQVGDGGVAIDATAAGDPNALLADLQALGLTKGAVAGRMVSGMLPQGSVAAAGALGSARFIRPAASMTLTGSVNSQGDPAMRTDAMRADLAVNGAGLTVGVLSNSYNCLGGAPAGVASNDLPAGVNVVEEAPSCTGQTDEGRGMMELIHDVAPGVAQAFHTANGGQANFATGITDLAAAGADIITDDVIYFAEPMFQDGVIAQAVDTVVGAGIPYFSSAGNQAANSYEQAYRSSGGSQCADIPSGFGGTAHDFDPGAGVDARQRFTVPNGRTVVVLQWDQPFFSVSGAPGSASDLDMCFYTTGGAPLFGVFGGNVGGDAVEVIGIINGGGPAQLDMVITRFSGPEPGKLKTVLFRSAASYNEFATNSSTSYGHNNAAGASATGAAFALNTPAFGVTPPLLETFSSRGGTPILFNTAGARLGAEVVRQTPDVVGPDGGNTTFFGADSLADPDAFPNFFGTSAAAPHTAAFAALLMQFNPGMLPAQVYSLLESTAIDMGPAGYDRDSGFGLVQYGPRLLAAICASGASPGPGAIVGTAGSDTINGTPGNDVIFGLGGHDVIDGLGGNDVIFGGDGNDNIMGGDGNDVICAGNGNDMVRGGSGNDVGVGDAGNDALFGQGDNDALFGNDGFDRLDGGTGTNTNDGGASSDYCINGTNTNCP